MTTDPIEPLLVKVQDAARILSLDPTTVYKLLDNGALEGVYIGRSRKVRVESLRAYVDGLPSMPPNSRSA